MRRTWGWLRWGVCAMRSPLAACRRRVGALDGVIPPIGGGELAVCGGVVAKLQTHWAKIAENRLFWLNGSAFWRIRCLSWCPGDMSCAVGPQPPWASQAGPRALRSRASRDTTEAGPRRIPPLVVCGGRAVGAGKPVLEAQRLSLSSAMAAAVASGANAQFFHQPLTVSTAWAPRSDSAEWALTRPEDRRAAWKREATFSQFTRFHQALT